MGTVINCFAILVGGLLGMLFGKFLNPRLQDGLTKACGISVLFIGIAGAMEKMLSVDGTALTGSGTMLVVGCLALGALVGELLNIEAAFARFGDWLKKKTGNAKDKQFVEGLL